MSRLLGVRTVHPGGEVMKLCTCGHKREKHSESMGCLGRVANESSCPCARFVGRPLPYISPARKMKLVKRANDMTTASIMTRRMGKHYMKLAEKSFERARKFIKQAEELLERAK